MLDIDTNPTAIRRRPGDGMPEHDAPDPDHVEYDVATTLPAGLYRALEEEGVDLASYHDHELAQLAASVAPMAPASAGFLEGLDEIAPGPMLAAALDAIDVECLSGFDRVVYVKAMQRQVSHYQAGLYGSMGAVTGLMQARDGYEGQYAEACEAAAAEIGAALRLTRRATEGELGLALDLKERHPEVLAALRSGAIDLRRARTIIYNTGHLPDATARRVAAQILDIASGLTNGQLYARLRAMCIEADPEAARERYRRSHDERRLVATPNVEGTADLGGYDLAPHHVSEIMNRINDIARSLRRNGENRTMDQLRADVYTDLLRGTNHAEASRGTIELHVPLDALQDFSNPDTGRGSPGNLAGFGPVIADIARQLAVENVDGEWHWSVTDPNTGAVLANGTTRRRPTAQQRRWLQARYCTCIFPGCRMPARKTDIDHTTPHSQGGPTHTDHLAPLCEHHHTIRHKHNWTYVRLRSGDHQWTSPLGHTHTTSGTPP